MQLFISICTTANTRSFFRLAMAFLLFTLGTNARAYTAVSDDISKVLVLQNHSYGDCQYSDEVALKISYEIADGQSGALVITATDTEQNSYSIFEKSVSEGRSTTLAVFDAGTCVTSLSINLELSQ